MHGATKIKPNKARRAAIKKAMRKLSPEYDLKELRRELEQAQLQLNSYRMHNNDLKSELGSLKKEHSMYIDARKLGEQEHERMLQGEIARLTAEVNSLGIENQQLKGALGYEVPGHIPPGNFKCGLCEAKTEALLEMEKRFGDQCERIKIVNYLLGGER